MELSELKKGALIFRLKTGKLPERLDDLMRPLDGLPDGVMNPVTKDPWGRPYQYKVLTPKTFLISTLGADGKPGGQGENADLDSDHTDFR